MPVKKINARDLIFEVSDGATVPVWTGVGFLTESEVDYSANEETADTTTYEDDGHYQQEIMQRGATMTLKGWSAQDPATGARDPGQQQIMTHAEKMGPDSQVPIRFRYPGSANWVTWTATVTRAAEGGANNAKLPFEYKFVRCGAAGSVAVA